MRLSVALALLAAAANAATIGDWNTCNQSTDTCYSTGWVCCVAPADTASGKTTCRPGGNVCAVQPIANWNTCQKGKDSCASSGWVCCVAPADTASGKATCRPGGNECAAPTIPDWATCNKATDKCSSTNWVCCVAPADTASGKTTCRPGGDQCAQTTAPIPDWATCQKGTDKCASTNWVWCVAPADVGSGKATCRPGGDQCASSTPTPSSGGGSGLARFLSADRFNQLFPSHKDIYTYDNMVKYSTEFEPFANSGNADSDKRELATFLAHTTHETGFLQFATEQYDPNHLPSYYPWVGRGALQLTGDYNYQGFAQAIGQDVKNQYWLVDSKQDLVWRSAFWWWHASGMHRIASQLNQFGLTINTINGGFECGSNPSNPDGQRCRIQYFKNYCQLFGIDPGSNLYC
ncbi:unnamed protein product [Aphanomyces euteiches]